MRILITGASGFVGGYLIKALQGLSDKPQIVAATLDGTLPLWPDVRRVSLDVADARQVDELVRAERPTHIVHLAGIAAPAQAERNVRRAWDVNTQGSLNIAFAIQAHAPACRLVFCSSGQVYGTSFREGRPLAEDAPLAPWGIYAASKAAADIFVGQMARTGLRAIRLRPFNHIGPRQPIGYVVPDFASQIAAIERDERDPVMKVGNLAMRRDFLDVRDVVEAYLSVIRRFDELPNGTAYNIASGGAVAVEDVLRLLLGMSSKKIEVINNPESMRASDLPLIAGDATAVRQALGWQPRRALADTLRAVLDYYRNLQS